MVADGAPSETSPDWILLSNINKYGADAVMGRPLGHDEVLRMNTTEAIISAYNSKFKSKDWAKWAQDNPNDNKILNHAMMLVEEHGWS